MKSTAGKSQLLEQAVESLHLLGFQIYDSLGQFKRAQIIPSRYVIRNYPDKSIYGTTGRKEALIVASSIPSDGLIPSPDGLARVMVEAKWQQTSGSVDEKMPFVWQSFLESETPNWLILMGGANWKTKRGQAVMDWMKRREAPVGRTWNVVDGPRGFNHFAMETWRTS